MKLIVYFFIVRVVNEVTFGYNFFTMFSSQIKFFTVVSLSCIMMFHEILMKIYLRLKYFGEMTLESSSSSTSLHNRGINGIVIIMNDFLVIMNDYHYERIIRPYRIIWPYLMNINNEHNCWNVLLIISLRAIESWGRNMLIL